MAITIWIAVIVLCIIAWSLRNSSSNIAKGKEGELLINKILTEIPGYKKIIYNEMFNDNGKSRQIDHIFINPNGIFVIETKNYSGTIYGKETYRKWFQYFGNYKKEIYNPLFQNFNHKRIIEKIIEADEIIIPIVVFTPRCNLKVETQKDVVLYSDQLIEYITSQPVKLNFNQIDEYYEKIMQSRITDSETINSHTKNLRHYLEYKSNLVKSNICPKCGNKLIIKQGKKGNFLGCTNYPKCKFTSNIQEEYNTLENNYKNNRYGLKSIKDIYNYLNESINVTTTQNIFFSLLLCIYFGWFGAHKFYEGRTRMGKVYLFTFGFFGVGWLCDIYILLFKTIKYFIK